MQLHISRSAIAAERCEVAHTIGPGGSLKFAAGSRVKVLGRAEARSTSMVTVLNNRPRRAHAIMPAIYNAQPQAENLALKPITPDDR